MTDGSSILLAIELVVGLLALAAIVAIVAKPLRVPYTVALVLVGLVVGGVVTGLERPGVDIEPELVLLVLLPGLVFEAAYRLKLGDIRRLVGGLALLAIPGVIVSAFVVAIFLSVFTGLRPDLAFIVGAMVSATDPAAVVATFKRIPVPSPLATVVDGESLLNDGTGLVLFAIAIQALAVPPGPVDAVVAFAGTIALSFLIGVAGGAIAARLVQLVDDHLVELTISVVLAYGSYLVADALGLSGVIATVIAAIVLGNFGRERVVTSTSADAIDTVWEFIAYLLTAIVFLLIGIAISPAQLIDAAMPIGVAVAGALAGRLLIVYVLLGGIARLAPLPGLSERLPTGWLHVLFWAGLRGAVAVAMALALPADIPQRELLQQITFGVVLFTLLVQATTVGRVVSRSIGPESASSTPSEEPAPI